MVTSSQLQIIQSPITSLLPAISTAITVKLDDTNYLVWQFQMKILLESHGILGFVDGSRKCPSRFDTDSDIEGVESDDHQIWKIHDRALMQLLIATLSSTAISYVIGCISSHDMWVQLQDRFSTVTKARIFQMKSELQTIKKGLEPVSQYLQRIKDARDHLSAAGVYFEDEDIVILALNGLSSDYNTFRCMVRGRDNVLSLKDFCSQLLAEEATIEQTHSSSPFVSAMHVQNQVPQGKALVLDEGNSNPLSSNFKSAPSSQFSSGFMEVLTAIRVVSMVITLVVIFTIVALSLGAVVEVAILSNLANDIILLNQALILVFLVLELICLLAKSVVREVMLLLIVINVTTNPQPLPLLFNVKFAGNMGILPSNVIIKATSPIKAVLLPSILVLWLLPFLHLLNHFGWLILAPQLI